MNGFHTLSQQRERLRALNAAVLFGWFLSLLLSPATLSNPVYGGMAYLPPGVWTALFFAAALGLTLTGPGQARAAYSALAAVLWGTLALSLAYPFLTSGGAVGSLPGVLLYAVLAASACAVALDGAK